MNRAAMTATNRRGQDPGLDFAGSLANYRVMNNIALDKNLFCRAGLLQIRK